MKKFIRTLSLLVCMALLMSNMPAELIRDAYAYAQEIPEMEILPIAEYTEETNAETVSEDETPADAGEMILEEMTVEEIPAEEIILQEEPSENAAASPEEVMPEQETDVPVETDNAVFEQGYARVLETAPVYAGSGVSDAQKARIGEGVVYVLGLSEQAERFEIAFYAGSESGIDSGWIDAGCVRPLEAEKELPSYIEFCEGRDYALINNRSELPLCAIPCEYPAAEAPEAAETEELAGMVVDAMLSESAAESKQAAVLSLSKTSMNLGKGEVFDVSELIIAEPENASFTYKLKTSNKAYVTVDNENGTIKGVKAGGSATITITPDNGQTAMKVKVSVKTAATKIAMKPASLTLVEGMSGKLSVSFNSSKYYGAHKFESANADIAVVDENGMVTALKPGTTSVTAVLESNPEKTATSEIVVLPVPERIAASVDSVLLNQGQQSKALYGKLPEDLAKTYMDASGKAVAPCNFIYTSSNPEIAQVDAETGVVTANNNGYIGEAVITVSAHNNPGATASCSVQVVSVSVSETAMNLGKGESFDITSLIKMEPEGCVNAYSFKTSNKKNVSVAANGVIKGVTAGKNATVTITPDNGLPAMQVKVYVRKTASKISLKPAEIEIGQLMGGKLTVGFNSSSHYGLYTIESSDPDTLTVDEKGNIFGIQPGEAVITASLKGKPEITASCRVSVLAAPEQISASISEIELGNGQVSEEFYGINQVSAPCNFIYTSSNPEIAQVDANGMITANSSGLTGIATITAAAHNNPAATAICTVEVVPAPDSISLKQSTLKIAKGETFDVKKLLQLLPEGSAAGYSFKTSNKKIVSVTAEGIIKGVKEGSTATITIAPHNGLAPVKLKVGVYKKPTSITLTPAEITLGQQMEGKLSVSFKSGYNGTYTLSSDNPNVVRVDESGAIFAYAPGSAVITATLNSNPAVQDTTVVNVQPAPEYISASVSGLKLGRGQVSRDLFGIADTMCIFSYESDATEIVSVDAASGELTAHANGNANITITAHNNPAAYVNVPVSVVDPPVGASLKQSSLTIGKGNTYDIRELIQLDPADSAAGYSFKTSSKSNVQVDADGIIKGMKAGSSATITITTHNGIAVGKVKVNVKKAPAAYSLTLSAVETGMQMPVKASVKFASGYTSLYEIISSNPEVALVDDQGNITPIAPGKTNIIVRNPNGSDAPKQASAELTVYAAPDTISPSHTNLQLSAGQSFADLKAISPEDTMCNFAFSCDSEILSVDKTSGRITVFADAEIGDTAVITLAAHNNPAAQASCMVEIVKQPEKAELTQTSLTIGAGDTFDIKKLVRLEDGSAASYSYSTSSKNYVSVNADGIIKGVKAGSYSNIKITTHNGLYVGAVKVNVKKAPGSIYLDPTEINLGVGMQAKIAASFASSSYFSLYTIASSDESIASLDAEGNVLALREGSTEIIAETQNGKKAKTLVNVLSAPSSAEFIEAEPKVAEGDKVDISAWVKLNEGAMASYAFESSNPEIAAINGNILTALRGGQAEISVTTHNGIKNTVPCVVNVVPAPSKLDFNDLPALVVAKGDSIVLPEPIATDAYGDECPTSYSYSVSGAYADYVRIEGNCLTGVKAGTAVVKVSAHNGVYTTLTVKIVSQPLTALELDCSEKTLYINENLNYADEMELQASFVSEGSINSGSLIYESSDPEVVAVQELRREDGSIYAKLSAVSPGSARITVSAFNGVSAICNIQVERLSESLTFEETNLTISEGKTYRMQPVFDEGSSAELTYTSSNPAVASVDEESGEVTAMMPGNAMIYAATQTGVTASVMVKVIAGPTGINLDIRGICLQIGESIVLEPELTADFDDADRSVSYESSDAGVAAVDDSGLVTAIAAGEAIITVKTCNGLTAHCTVTVIPEGGETKAEFGWASATIVNGDTAELNFTLNKQAYEQGFTITSSDPSIVEVIESNWTIRAKAAGDVTLNYTVHSAEGEVNTLPETISANVAVVNGIKPVFSAKKVSVQVYSDLKPEKAQAELLLSGIPDDLIGSYKLYVEDEALAVYDSAAGIVRAASELIGTTRVVCEVYGASAACVVNVLADPIYRAVIIAEYNNSKETGSNLPFANNNAKSMRTVLKNSYIDGKTYEQITYLSSNPTQAQIKSAIETTFADAREGDVSLIYIVSHGYYTKDRGYYFGTPYWEWKKQDTVITSSELLDWMRPIEGNVVLVLDSCRSGGFLKDAQAEVEAEGNIAVITAQTYDRNASYFDGSSAATKVEFMTYVFCQGLGYEYDTQSWIGLQADANRDGLVSVSEVFSYTKSRVPKLVKQKAEDEGWLAKGVMKIPGVKNWSDYYEWGGQYPQVYIPETMKDLVIYGE